LKLYWESTATITPRIFFDSLINISQNQMAELPEAAFDEVLAQRIAEYVKAGNRGGYAGWLWDLITRDTSQKLWKVVREGVDFAKIIASGDRLPASSRNTLLQWRPGGGTKVGIEVVLAVANLLDSTGGIPYSWWGNKALASIVEERGPLEMEPLDRLLELCWPHSIPVLIALLGRYGELAVEERLYATVRQIVNSDGVSPEAWAQMMVEGPRLEQIGYRRRRDLFRLLRTNRVQLVADERAQYAFEHPIRVKTGGQGATTFTGSERLVTAQAQV
jgi:hypothetical protein